MISTLDSPAHCELSLKLTDRLAPFDQLKKRFKIALGGRAGTKSQTCVDILIKDVQIYGKRVCCFREFGASIEDSIWTLIKDEIARMNVPGFTVQDRKIYHENGGFFKSKGLGRDSKSVKSFSGFDIFLVEEGDFLTEAILRDLTPTLRKDDSELWVIFNPQSRTDAVSKRFLIPFYKDLLKNKVYEDDLHYIVWTNYDENPWMPEVLEQERQFDKKHLTKAEYNHKWLGFFNDTVTNAIMKLEWLEACVDAHLILGFEALGQKITSHDPSDTGYDDKGLVDRQGSVITEALLNKTGDVNEGMDWALEHAVSNGSDLLVWDADGMGLSLKRQVKDYLSGEGCDYRPFRGGEAVEEPTAIFEDERKKGEKKENRKKVRTNKQALKNLRAQKYWELRTRVYNTFLAITKPEYRHQDPDNLISFSSEITELDMLFSELSRIPRKPNTGGLIQIMSKQDMSRLDIDSPNLADPTMMSLITPDIRLPSEPIKFTQPWSN